MSAAAATELRRQIEQLVEQRQRRDGDGVEYEAELRLGVCADSRGARVRSPNDAVAQFASNIGATHFYATFEQLYERADEVSELALSNVAHYSPEATGGRRGVRSESDVAESLECERWTDKRQLQRHDRPFPAWFDVRLTLSEERRIDAPPAVLEARQLARRVRHPWQQPRTRLGVAVHSRRRARRSMRFRDARAWRIDFTRVSSTMLVRRPSDFGAGTGELYHLESSHDDTHEIELEYAPRQSQSRRALEPAEAAAQAMRLLARLATALGRTARDVRRRIQRDRHAAEMRVMASIHCD